MQYQPPEHELDPSGSNSSNYISNEQHTLPYEAIRVIAPVKGVYHEDSLIVKDKNNNTLTKGTHYLPFYIHDDVSLKYDTGLYSLIIILDPFVTNYVTISYQFLGDIYTNSDQSLADNYNVILSNQEPNDLEKILNPRSDYLDPDVSLPHEDRQMRIGTILNRLEKIRRAISYADPDVYRVLLEHVKLRASKFNCYVDMKILPSRDPTNYAQFLVYLQDRAITSTSIIYTDNCNWYKGTTQKVYVDTSLEEFDDMLYWEIFTTNEHIDISKYISSPLLGEFQIDRGITEIEVTIRPLEDVFINFEFFVAISKDMTRSRYMGTTMPITIKDN